MRPFRRRRSPSALRRIRELTLAYLSSPPSAAYCVGRNADGKFHCPLCQHTYQDTESFRTHLLATNRCCLVHQWPLPAMPNTWSPHSGPSSPAASPTQALGQSAASASSSPTTSTDALAPSSPAISTQSLPAVPTAGDDVQPAPAPKVEPEVASFLTVDHFGLSEKEIAALSQVAAKHGVGPLISPRPLPARPLTRVLLLSARQPTTGGAASPGSLGAFLHVAHPTSSAGQAHRAAHEPTASTIGDIIQASRAPPHPGSSSSASAHAGLLDLLDPLLSLPPADARLLDDRRASAEAHVYVLACLLAPTAPAAQGPSASEKAQSTAKKGEMDFDDNDDEGEAVFGHATSGRAAGRLRSTPATTRGRCLAVEPVCLRFFHATPPFTRPDRLVKSSCARVVDVPRLWRWSTARPPACTRG